MWAIVTYHIALSSTCIAMFFNEVVCRVLPRMIWVMGYRVQPNIINLHQIMGSTLLLSVSGGKSSLSGGKSSLSGGKSSLSGGKKGWVVVEADHPRPVWAEPWVWWAQKKKAYWWFTMLHSKRVNFYHSMVFGGVLHVNKTTCSEKRDLRGFSINIEFLVWTDNPFCVQYNG